MKSSTLRRRYYVRYLQPWNTDKLVDPEAEKYWLPVDLYVGKPGCALTPSPSICISTDDRAAFDLLESLEQKELSRAQLTNAVVDAPTLLSCVQVAPNMLSCTCFMPGGCLDLDVNTVPVPTAL